MGINVLLFLNICMNLKGNLVTDVMSYDRGDHFVFSLNNRSKNMTLHNNSKHIFLLIQSL